MHRLVRCCARASVLLFAATLVFVSGTTASGQPAPVIRVAVIPLEVSAEPYYARETGVLAKDGIDFDIQSIQSGVAIASAVASNAVDVGYVSIVALAQAHIKGIPLVAIGPAAEYRSSAPTTAIVVAAASSIRSGKDLNGKVVAVSGLNNFPEYSARAWVDTHGGDPSTVKWVEIPFPSMAAAVGAGRVDAAVISEPFVAVAKLQGLRLLGYPNDAVAKDFVSGVWVTTVQWATSHPELVRRFSTTMHDVAVWANQRQNDATSGAILVKDIKIDPSIVGTMSRARFGERLTATSMQPSLDLATKYGNFPALAAQELMYTPPR